MNRCSRRRRSCVSGSNAALPANVSAWSSSGTERSACAWPRRNEIAVFNAIRYIQVEKLRAGS